MEAAGQELDEVHAWGEREGVERTTTAARFTPVFVVRAAKLTGGKRDYPKLLSLCFPIEWSLAGEGKAGKSDSV